MAKNTLEATQEPIEQIPHTAPATTKTQVDEKKSPNKQKFTLLKDVTVGVGKHAKTYKKGERIELTEKGKKHFQHKKLI